MSAEITYLVELSTDIAEPVHVPFAMDRFDQWSNPADAVVFATFTSTFVDDLDAVA